ncbi:hypothetical protein [Burkholderia gladioli]|uniref:hypothetical protein n=1 Tax=Burkholderia gladioli TaxID=28095 RepID=UPI001641782D|nr:hypothetical protein [Burkholderia gladioli]
MLIDFAFAFTDHRDERFDTLMPSPTPRGIRRLNESRRASQRARKHIELAAQARNQARSLVVEPAPMDPNDAPSVRDTLAAWDAAQATAQAHFAAAEEAYRLSRLLPNRTDDESVSLVWRAVLNGLMPVEA